MQAISCNVGGVERVVRIFLAVALLALALLRVVGGLMAIVAYTVGGIAFVTGAIGFCPAWTVFGINTCGVKHVQAKAGGAGR